MIDLQIIMTVYVADDAVSGKRVKFQQNRISVAGDLLDWRGDLPDDPPDKGEEVNAIYRNGELILKVEREFRTGIAYIRIWRLSGQMADSMLFSGASWATAEEILSRLGQS